MTVVEAYGEKKARRQAKLGSGEGKATFVYIYDPTNEVFITYI